MAILPSKSGRRRLVLLVYIVALAQVTVIFTLGEPYPTLQGPLFAGHLQSGRTVYVPFYRENGSPPDLPFGDKLLRYETLALPAQDDMEALSPQLSGWAAKNYLIGHSLRTPSPRRRPSGDFAGVNWSTYKFYVPLDSPPKADGEVDIIAD